MAPPAPLRGVDPVQQTIDPMSVKQPLDAIQPIQPLAPTAPAPDQSIRENPLAVISTRHRLLFRKRRSIKSIESRHEVKINSEGSKGALSQNTVKLMVFKLLQAASKTWRRLNGKNQLPKVIEGTKFTDGVAVVDATKTSAA
jgi:hypothetical protein